jgi:signal transduction histidine kinase
MASAAASVNGEEALFSAICKVLGDNTRDLPFTLSYLFSEDRATARLVCASGIKSGDAAAPDLIRCGEGPWPTTPLNSGPLNSGDAALIVDLAGLFAELPHGDWDVPPREALVSPISPQGQGQKAPGFLVTAINPYRRLDSNYRQFLSLIAGQIGAALATARAYEAERRRAEALAQLDRAKTTFFSNVSHEFRTPLTLILGTLEEVLAAEHKSRAWILARAETAHRNGMRLLRLVNTLLDFSRLESGRAHARYEPTDLAAFTAQIAATFRDLMERAGLALEVRCEDIGQPVFVDREMWEKILLNLLSNAFKFTHAGRVTVSTRRSDEGAHAEVRVSDTGVGIAASELPRLFERFHRVEGAAGRSFEGSGIGLALVRELVSLHGGDIAVESEPDVGSTFRVRLPLGRAHLAADGPQAPPHAPASNGGAARTIVNDALHWLQGPDTMGAVQASEPVPSAPTVGAGKTILVADDNVDMLEYVRRLLVSQGYTVRAVADGQAALEAARIRPPDLILTDVMMPRLDGFGLLRAVRAEPELAAIPVIVLSARAGEEAKVEGLDQGADDYLVKPFAARELLARVNANVKLAAARRDAANAVIQSRRRVLMSEERLSLALSTGRVTVFERDLETGHMIVHGPLAAEFGISAAAAEQGLPNESVVRGIHPDDIDRVRSVVSDAVETGRTYEVEHRLQSGAVTRTVLSRGQLQTTSEGARRLVGAVVDITEEKAAEAALNALNANLKALVAAELGKRVKIEEALRHSQKMEAVGQLTGGVAHDFNNLLTVMIGGMDTVLRADPRDHARIARAAKMALQGAQRAASLTGRLLAFSRRQSLNPTYLDLNELVRDLNHLLHRTLGENIELEGVLAQGLWTVEIDQNLFENALLNLAVNSRDAMPDGGRLTLETANAVLDESYKAADPELIPGEYAMVSVGDTGHGMSADVLARVFEPFFTTKEVGRGTGLGLSMVYGFVKQSGGHITLDSQEGVGTTVRLYFPRRHGVAASFAPAADTKIPLARGEEVVLVVEDNDEVRAHSVAILTELGYGVLEAANADAGLTILTSDAKVDLLFTDVVLPGKTGRMLADAARAIHPGLRVLYTTGYARDAIVHHGRLDPGVNLIAKPFRFEDLAVSIRDALDR